MAKDQIRGVKKVVVTDSEGKEHTYVGTGEGFARVTSTNDGAKPVPKRIWKTVTVHLTLEDNNGEQ